ncbi:efflux RND transporter periplasmic adaptor subunit [Nitrospina gracilis]|nr:efflux RND transporter periplasmic adaptor subunit [Nitrospina gracilis]
MKEISKLKESLFPKKIPQEDLQENLDETLPVEEELDNVEGDKEEVLFPLERIEPGLPAPMGKRFSLIRSGLLLFLIVGVFFLGFATQPEVLKQLLGEGKQWVDVGMKKARPLGNRIYEKTEEMVNKIHGNKESPKLIKTKSGNKKKKTDKKVKYWRAPMTPGFVSDRPGKSPMGMDLIPVYEDEADGGVSISPTMVQNIGVKTQVIKTMALSREIRTVGRLTYDERLVHHIHTKYGGWIEKLYVDFTGQEVNKNDVLLEIYSPELVSTQEELILALKYEASLKNSIFPEISRGAKSLVDSTLKRLELFDVPQHQIDELVKSKKVAKTLHIHSPVKGFVLKKNALHGMYVKPGMNLYMIANLSNIWLIADIYEYEIPWIKLGQAVEMNLSYFPGKPFKGKVTFINPMLDSKSRTLKVRMEFSNPNGELKPEMYANVTLQSEVSKKTIAVPEEAVIYSGDKTMVMIQKPSGDFESRELNLGVKTQGYVQVLSGLKAGERVVTSSTFLIDSESRIKEAFGKMEKAGKPEAMKHETLSPDVPKRKLKLHLGEAPQEQSKHKMN